MNKIILLSSALMLAMNANAQKTIKNPPFSYSKSDMLAINSVTLTDTATTVNLTVTLSSPGNMFKVNEGTTINANGKEYGIRSTEGVKPGEKCATDENGKKNFTINFQPIPKSAKSFDFIEPDGWNVLGVRLDGKRSSIPLPKKLKSIKTTENYTLPQPKDAYGKANVKVHIIAENGMLDKINPALSYLDELNDDFRRVDMTRTGTAENEAIYEATPEIYSIQNCNIFLGTHEYRIYAAPDETSEAYIVADRIATGDKSAYFTGYCKELNDEINTIDFNIFDYNHLAKIDKIDLTGKLPEDFKNDFKNIYISTSNELESLDASNNFKEIVNAEMQIAALLVMANASGMLNKANKGHSYDIPASFYDDITALNIFNNKYTSYAKYRTMLVYMAQRVRNITPEFTKQTNEFFKSPFGAALEANRKIIDEYTPLTPKETAELKATSPALFDIINEKNNNLLARISETKDQANYRINNLPENLTGNDVFNGIIENFKGKPILVDIWATWCVPCMGAMETIKPLKKELAGKVTFVYVTSESSPKDKWNTIIQLIDGEHFYINFPQYRALIEQFKISGIPAYILVDKDGNVIDSFSGFPGVDVIREKLGF